MSDFNAWMGNTTALSTWTDDADRAYDTARVIAAKSSSITITRNGAQLDAQTVRLEPLGSAGERKGENAIVSNAGVLIVGYKSHPSITDTSVKRGDRFYYASQLYTVTQVLPDVPDRLLAIAEVSP